MAQWGRSAVSLIHLLGAGFVRDGLELRLWGQGGATATLTAAGSIQYGGAVHPSPSTAARAAKGGTSTNGWKAWEAREDDGSWVDLSELRRRFMEKG
jgi:hypothetical protein